MHSVDESIPPVEELQAQCAVAKSLLCCCVDRCGTVLAYNIEWHTQIPPPRPLDRADLLRLRAHERIPASAGGGGEEPAP